MTSGITRRNLLKAALGAATVAGAGTLARAPSVADATPSPTTPSGFGTSREWSNWSGNQMSRPESWLRPATERDLVAQLRSARGSVRTTGAGHSFSPLVKTDDTLVSLDQMAGVIEHDAKSAQATVWAGTRIRHLGDPLWERGQALINQGDIDAQSIAGAIGTSTHGTGATLGSLSSVVRGLRMVTASGEIVDCAADRDSDVFHAARTSLGALGIVTQIRLQNRPTYNLHERTYTMPLTDVLRTLDELRTANRHFEFWAFFHAPNVIVKTLNETDAPPTPPSAFDLPTDAVLWAASEVAHGIPALDGSVQRALMALVPSTEKVDRSYRIFPSPRDVRFNEMEYELPAEHGPDCVREILETVRTRRINTLFPVEYRTVAADDCWLSPFYGRASVAISIHQYHKRSYAELFSVVEPIFWKFGGRPHWGKLHTLTARELAPLYPKWDAFQAVRRRLDPKGRFMNEHLRRVLEA